MLATLESALCQGQKPAFQLWLSIRAYVAYLFAHPEIALIGMMVLIGLLWAIAHRYLSGRLRKRYLRLWGLGLLLSGLVLVSPLPPALGSWLLVSFIPPDSGEIAQVIVMLGRGSTENVIRAQAGADLWRSHRAPLIFSSGQMDAQEMARLLQQKEQVPKAVIVQERCSSTTEENAKFTAAILRSRGLQKIILVTDPLHMLRSLLTFKSFGFEIIAHPVPLAEDIRPNYSQFPNHSQFLAFRESLGIVSYALMGRYFPQQVSETTIREADKLVAQQLKQGAARALEKY
ncbi:MAG: YdcF family protein [Phormidesmis sp.]